MLQGNDMVTGAKKSDYKLIAQTAGVDVGLFVESSLARGGCFWSERYMVPIPGVIKHGRKIGISDFVSGIKAMKKL